MITLHFTRRHSGTRLPRAKTDQREPQVTHLKQRRTPNVGSFGEGEKMVLGYLKRSFAGSAKRFLAGISVALLTTAAVAQNRVDFSLRSIDKQTVTSDSLRGEVVVLAFGASWLPLSKTQLQGVRKLADEYSKRGVVVYWVSTESEDPKSKNH